MSRFDDLMCRWVASGFDVGRNAAGEGKIEVGNPLSPAKAASHDLLAMVENPNQKTDSERHSRWPTYQL